VRVQNWNFTHKLKDEAKKMKWVVKEKGKGIKVQERGNGGFLSRNGELQLLQWRLRLHLRRSMISLFFSSALGSTIE